jgi:hypothetical protein
MEQTTPAVLGPVERMVRPRSSFEAWISAPPFEREVERFGEHSAWPGNYREIDVDLAWQAWSAAVVLTRDRCAKLCEASSARWDAIGGDGGASLDCADAIRGA